MDAQVAVAQNAAYAVPLSYRALRLHGTYWLLNDALLHSPLPPPHWALSSVAGE